MDNFNWADWLIVISFAADLLANMLLSGEQKLKAQSHYKWYNPLVNIPIIILVWSNSIFFASLLKF